MYICGTFFVSFRKVYLTEIENIDLQISVNNLNVDYDLFVIN
jgi:hypothetical protein